MEITGADTVMNDNTQPPSHTSESRANVSPIETDDVGSVILPPLKAATDSPVAKPHPHPQVPNANDSEAGTVSRKAGPPRRSDRKSPQVTIQDPLSAVNTTRPLISFEDSVTEPPVDGDNSSVVHSVHPNTDNALGSDGPTNVNTNTGATEGARVLSNGRRLVKARSMVGRQPNLLQSAQNSGQKEPRHLEPDTTVTSQPPAPKRVAVAGPTRLEYEALKASENKLKQQARARSTRMRNELETLQQERHRLAAEVQAKFTEYQAQYVEEKNNLMEEFEVAVENAKEDAKAELASQYTGEMNALWRENEALRKIKDVSDNFDEKLKSEVTVAAEAPTGRLANPDEAIIVEKVALELKNAEMKQTLQNLTAEHEEMQTKNKEMERRIEDMSSAHAENLKMEIQHMATEYGEKLKADNLTMTEQFRRKNNEMDCEYGFGTRTEPCKIMISTPTTPQLMADQEEHSLRVSAEYDKKLARVVAEAIAKERDEKEDTTSQVNELQQRCEELQAHIAKTNLEFQGELEKRNIEILAMRRRLDTAHPEPTQVSPNSPQPRTSGSESMPMNPPNEGSTGHPSPRRHAFLQSEGTPIGIVPLQPPSATPRDISSGGRSSLPKQGFEFDASNTELVGEIVKETLKQMGASGVNITKTRRKTSCDSWSKAIKAQQESITREADIAWKAIVRKTWREIYGIDTMDKFSIYNPASADDVGDCEVEISTPRDTWVLDFNKGWKRSRWNRLILGRIYERVLLKSREDGQSVPNVSREYLLGELYGQVKRAREVWSQAQPRYQPSTGNIETAKDIIKRVETTNAQRLSSVGSHSRRERKFARRSETVDKVIAIKLGQHAPDLATWEYFCKMLEMLGPEGMSSEEEGVEKISNINVPVFQVRFCVWRAPEIREYFKYIDREGDGQAICGTKGSRALPRIPIEDTGVSPAPAGLPHNMYDPTWLGRKETSRPGWVVEELRISKEAFELLKFVTHL